MKTNDYKSGNIAKLIGATHEALRFYHNKNIYSPRKKGQTKYDIYSDHDLACLYNLRSYKTLGLTLKDSGDNIKNQTFESISNNITICMESVERSNQWNEIILNHIKRLKNLAVSIESSFNDIIEGNMPEMYVFSLLDNKGITKEELIVLKELATLTPVIVPINRISSKYFKDTYMESTSLLGIQVEDMWFFEKYYDLSSLIEKGVFKKIQAKKCLSSIIRIDLEHKYDDKVFSHVIKYLDTTNYILSDEVYGSVIAVNYKRKNDVKNYDYYISWIPIEVREL